MSDRLKAEAEPPELERRKPSAIFKDARVDRAVTWLLGVLALAGLSMLTSKMGTLDEGQAHIAKDSGEWQLKVSRDLGDFKAELNMKLATVASDIAVLKDERREIIDLKASLKTLEQRLHDLEIAPKGK